MLLRAEGGWRVVSESADRIWHIYRRDHRIGPVTALELAWLAKERHLKPTDFIWCRGLPDWIQASSVAGLIPTPEQQATPQSATPVSAAPAPPPQPAPVNRLMSIHERFQLSADDPFARAARSISRASLAPQKLQASAPAASGPDAESKTVADRLAGALQSRPAEPSQPAPAPSYPATTQPRRAAPRDDVATSGNLPAMWSSLAAALTPATPAAPTTPVTTSTSLAIRDEPPRPADTGSASQWRELLNNDVGKSMADALIVVLDRLEIRSIDDLAADWRLQSIATDAYDTLPGTVRFLINQTIGRKTIEDYILDMLTHMKSRIPLEQRSRDLRLVIREMSASPWFRDKLSAAAAKTRTGLGSLMSSYAPSRILPQGWWSTESVAASTGSAPLMLTSETAAIARAELL